MTEPRVTVGGIPVIGRHEETSGRATHWHDIEEMPDGAKVAIGHAHPGDDRPHLHDIAELRSIDYGPSLLVRAWRRLARYARRP